MSGYAKSVVFPSSSTLPELALSRRSGVSTRSIAYKVYVLLSAAVVPWMIALACMLWRVSVRGMAIAVLLDMLVRLVRLSDQLRLPGDVAVLPGGSRGSGGDAARSVASCRHGDSPTG